MALSRSLLKFLLQCPHELLSSYLYWSSPQATARCVFGNGVFPDNAVFPISLLSDCFVLKKIIQTGDLCSPLMPFYLNEHPSQPIRCIEFLILLVSRIRPSTMLSSIAQPKRSTSPFLSAQSPPTIHRRDRCNSYCRGTSGRNRSWAKGSGSCGRSSTSSRSSFRQRHEGSGSRCNPAPNRGGRREPPCT